MPTSNNRRPGRSDDSLLTEARIAGLRAALARADSVQLPKLPNARHDKMDVLGQQLKAAIVEPGSQFTTRLLRNLAQRSCLDAILAGIDDDLTPLLEQIIKHLSNDTELSSPDRADWAEALAVAARLRALNHYSVPNSRRGNLRAALGRLVALGHDFKLAGTGIDPASDGFRTVTRKVVEHLAKLGRFDVFRNLEASARAVHGYEFDQILYGRNSSNSPREASIPFGYLWQLAARLPDLPVSSADPAAEWKKALELACDVVALTDVETYGQFWMIGASTDKLTQLLANAALHDHLFSVQQWSAHITPLLLRSFFGTERDEELRAKLGWGIGDAATAVETIIGFAKCSPAIFTREQLLRRLPASTVDALLRDLTHMPPGPNTNYTSPFDARSADLMFKPFFAGRAPDTFFVPSMSTMGPACYEAVAAALRCVLSSGEISDITGKGLERALGQLLRSRHLAPTIEGKCYSDGADQGECDLVLEDDQTILFIECKAKALTRAAMAGDPQDAVFAYLQGVVASQAQALQHESILMTKGKIEFDDGTVLERRDRDIVRVSVTLFDHGTLQDRFLFGQLSSVLATSKLSAANELADKALRRRVEKTNATLERLRRHLTEDLGDGADISNRIWARALPTASLSIGHLAILLIEYTTVSGLAKVLRKPATFATGSVLKEYHYLRFQKLI